MSEKIKLKRIMEVTGATHSQVQWWVRKRYIEPQSEPRDCEKAGRERATRYYGIEDAIRIGLLRVLMDAGIQADDGSKILNVVKELLRNMEHRVGGSNLDRWKFSPLDTWLLHLTKKNDSSGADIVVKQEDKYLYLELKRGRGKRDINSETFGPFSKVVDNEKLSKGSYKDRLDKAYFQEKKLSLSEMEYDHVINLSAIVNSLRQKL